MYATLLVTWETVKPCTRCSVYVSLIGASLTRSHQLYMLELHISIAINVCEFMLTIYNCINLVKTEQLSFHPLYFYGNMKIILKSILF